METWQVNHINKNLVKLQTLTICNDQLRAVLKSQNVISQEEFEKLDRLGDLHGNLKKASELYHILQTRIRGYEILVKGLFELSQSGALKILLEGYEDQGIYNPFQLCKIKLDVGEISTRHVLFQNTKSLLSNFCIRLDNFQEIFMKYLGAREYFQLVEKDVKFYLFAKTVPNPVSYYIKRYVNKPNKTLELNSGVFKEQCKDVFVIKDISRKQLDKLAGLNATCLFSEQRWKPQLTARFISIENDTQFKAICQKSKAPTHLIHHESEKFKLIKSRNGLIDPQYLKTSQPLTLTEDQLVDLWKNSEEKEHVLLSDTPGMGKTEFMVSLANEMMKSSKDQLIIFVKFDEFCMTMDSQTISFTKIWENLLNLGCRSYFGKQLLTELTKTEVFRTLLFIDGFDEVLPKHQELSLEVLKSINENSEIFNIKIILSTRPHNRAVMEALFDFEVYTLVPFTREDQPECVLNYWEKVLQISRNVEVENFVHRCFEVLETKLNTNNEQPIAGLPLQCRLIAEVYQDIVIELTQEQSGQDLQTSEMFDFTLVGLYQKFLELRLRVFPTKAEDILKAHYRYAVELLFPDWLEKLGTYFVSDAIEEDILKAGILEKLMGKTRFVHRTLAEYILAQFLKDLLTDEKGGKSDGIEFLLNRVLTSLGYSDKLGDEDQMSYKFIYPVICYFLNGFLQDAENFHSPDMSDGNLIRNIELCYETLYASVLANHVPLFQFVRKIYLTGNADMVLVQLLESKVEWSNLALSAANYSNTEIFEECLDFIEKLPTDIPHGLPEKLVFTTVQRGIYSIFKIAFKQFPETRNTSKDLSDLLRKCVKNSKFLPLAERLDILDFILDNQDEDLLDKVDSKGNTVLFEKNINIDVLVYLAEKDSKLTTQRNNLDENIVHLVVQYLTPADLHGFFNLKNVKKSLLRLLKMKDIQGHTALQSIVMNLDPIEKTMELMTSLPGFEISYFESFNSSILAEAVVHGRQHNLLKHLVKNGASMKSFFDNSLSSGNEIHFSIKNKNLSAVDFFLEQGVSFRERNKEGKSPFEYANNLFARQDISEEFMFGLREILIKRGGVPAELHIFPVLSKRLKTSSSPETMNTPFKKSNALPDFCGLNFQPSFLSLSKQQKSSPEESTSVKEETDPLSSSSSERAVPESQELAQVNLETPIKGIETDVARASFPCEISDFPNKFWFVSLHRKLLKYEKIPYELRHFFVEENKTSKLKGKTVEAKIMEQILLKWTLILPEEATLGRLLDALDGVSTLDSVAGRIRRQYKLSEIRWVSSRLVSC